MQVLIHVIEFLFACALFVNALLFIPQIYRLYKEKSAKGVSLTTFGGFWPSKGLLFFMALLKVIPCLFLAIC